MIKQGPLRGELTLHDDGVGACVWYPFPGEQGKDEKGEEEQAGLCFDFELADIDDFITLLQRLKTDPPKDLRTKAGESVTINGQKYMVSEVVGDTIVAVRVK